MESETFTPQPDQGELQKPPVAKDKTTEAPVTDDVVSSVKSPDQELREYTKDYKAGERAETAKEIREKRTEYFERQKSLTQEIQDLKAEIDARRGEAEVLAGQIEILEDELTERKSNFISRVFDSKKLKGTEELLGIKVRDKTELETRVNELLDRLQEASGLLSDDSELIEAREMLTGFYSEKLKDYMEYLDVSDVSKVIEDKNVVFVHGLSVIAPTQNSQMSTAATIEQKAIVDLALTPDLSCSTIRQGDGRAQYWSEVGLLLNGGRIRAASKGDAATIAGRGGRRNFGHAATENLGKAIQGAIEHDPSSGTGGYNEIVVRNPEICGFYVSLDVGISDLPISIEKVENILKNLGLPLYGVENGVLYEVEIGDVEGRDGYMWPGFIKKGQVDSARTTEMPTVSPSSADKEALCEKMLEDSPFAERLLPEVGLLHQRTYGRELYLKHQFSKDASDGRLITDSRYLSGKEQSGEFYGPRTKTSYGVTEEGDPFLIRSIVAEWDHNPKFNIPSSIESAVYQSSDSGYLFQAIYQLSQTESGETKPGWNESGLLSFGSETVQDIDNTLNILDGVLSSLQNNDEKLKDWIFEKKDETITELGFFLLGIAEQAEEAGDSDVAKRAREIASKAISEEEYRGILQKRLGEDGKVKLTQEELDSFAKK